MFQLPRFFKALLLTSLLVAPPVVATDVFEQLTRLNIPKPSVALQKVAIKAISLQDIALQLDTAIKNPYPVNLPKAGMDLNLNIEGNKLVQLTNGKIAVNAMKDAVVPFDVKLKYQDLANIYKKVSNKEALNMDLAGAVNVFLPVDKLKAKGMYFKGMPGTLPFPIKFNRLLPAVLPSINLRNFKIQQPSLNDVKAVTHSDQLANQVVNFMADLLNGKSAQSAAKAGLSNVDFPVNTEFELVLNNNAASKVLFERLKYDLMLGGEKFLTGDSTKIENRGKESVVTVKSTFPIKTVSQGIANMIKTRKAAFQLKGVSDLNVPALPDGKVPFNFDHKGNLSW